MDSVSIRLGWTDTCCICGQNAVCYHNPDPLREGVRENCCEACNRLVIAARRKIDELPQGERAAYTQMLRGLPHKSLARELFKS